jgi:RNA polymerase primary sigma factor
VETLTSEEEVALAIRIQQGDKEALSELVVKNFAFVKHIAKQFVGRGVDYDDLVSEGNIGLINAARNFQPIRYNTRFSTHAYFNVYQAMRHALNGVPMVHIPCWIYRLYRRLAKRGVDCLMPPTQERADTLGISLRKLTLVYRAACCLQFIDLENPLEEVLVDRPTQVFESHPALEASLDTLEPIDAFILTLRYGLDDDPPLSLAEVGSYCGYSREYIRVRQRVALTQLKERLIV